MSFANNSKWEEVFSLGSREVIDPLERYPSSPMIGLIPASFAAKKNSTTPNIVPWSVIATAGIFISLTRVISLLIFVNPSKREYSV